MKIPAGILMMAAAFINIFGGTAYVFGGACFHMFADTVEGVTKEHEKEAGESRGSRDVKKASSRAKKMGSAAIVFGLFLWLLTILQFVAGVLLFLQSNRGYVMTICLLSIAAEVVGMVAVTFSYWQLCGMGAGVLGFIAALSFPDETQARPSPA